MQQPSEPLGQSHLRVVGTICKLSHDCLSCACVLSLMTLGRRLSVRQTVVGFQGLAAGISYMHARGLVDQDLHTRNVLLSADGQAFVKVDLG